MSIFMCKECKCIENTALSNYWFEYKKLCSECDPRIGKWHDVFEKSSATGMILGEDGFLYNAKPHHTKIIGIL